MPVKCIKLATGNSVRRALLPYFRDLPGVRSAAGRGAVDEHWGIGEKEKGEGKIKAQSREASYVIVCTSFFRETLVLSLPIREIFGQESQLIRAFALSRYPLRHRYNPQLMCSA